jgi:hypothetical protein
LWIENRLEDPPTTPSRLVMTEWIAQCDATTLVMLRWVSIYPPELPEHYPAGGTK